MDFGFRAEKALTVRLEIPASAYRESRRRQAFFASIVQETGALPGVQSVGTTPHVPILDPGNTWETRTPDRPIAAGAPAEHTHLRYVSPGYFTTMSMPLLKGREISEADRDGTPDVAVLSESLARRLYAHREPVGRTVLLIDSLSSPPRALRDRGCNPEHTPVRSAGRRRAGSVRKAGNQLRITAQLANAEDGYHLLSERYDREMKDIFPIQEEIAQSIVATLKATLSPKESDSIASVSAVSVSA